MAPRLVAFLLAVVLAIASVAPQEALPSSGLFGSAQAAAASPATKAAGSARTGSVDEHYLDDQPVQAQAGAALDLPGLLSARFETPLMPSLSAAAPRARAAVACKHPFLEGILRPPCAPAPLS